MGPLLFRAEDSRHLLSGMPVASSLQWGRSCSERKTRQRETCPPQRNSKLQWGRSCSERKTARILNPCRKRLCDSVFERGGGTSKHTMGSLGGS